MILTRDKKDQTIETKGLLTLVNGVSFKTLELPWRGNTKKISCIPVGTYEWVKRGSTKAIPYTHILLLNVKGRDGICIHSANYAAGKTVQLLGCIAVGKDYKDINGDGIDDITNSKATFQMLMSLLPDKGTIEIK